MGIEPTYVAWKATALPLSYTRICRYHYNPFSLIKQGAMVGVRGFEPRASCSQGRRATKLRHTPQNQAEESITQIHSQVKTRFPPGYWAFLAPDSCSCCFSSF